MNLRNFLLHFHEIHYNFHSRPISAFEDEEISKVISTKSGTVLHIHQYTYPFIVERNISFIDFLKFQMDYFKKSLSEEIQTVREIPNQAPQKAVEEAITALLKIKIWSEVLSETKDFYCVEEGIYQMLGILDTEVKLLAVFHTNSKKKEKKRLTINIKDLSIGEMIQPFYKSLNGTFISALSFETFVNILFTGVEVIEKLNWIGTLYQLRCFIDVLVEENRLRKYGGYSKAAQTFLCNGQAFTRININDAKRKGTKGKRGKKEFERIIKLLPA